MPEPLPRLKYVSTQGFPFRSDSAEGYQLVNNPIPPELAMGTALGVFILPKNERLSTDELFAKYSLWEGPNGICPVTPALVQPIDYIKAKTLTVWSKQPIFAGTMVAGFGYVVSAKASYNFETQTFRTDIQVQSTPLVPNLTGQSPRSPRQEADDNTVAAIKDLCTAINDFVAAVQSGLTGLPADPPNAGSAALSLAINTNMASLASHTVTIAQKITAVEQAIADQKLKEY